MSAQMTAADLVALLRGRASHEADSVAYIFDDGAGTEHPVSYGWLDRRARAVAAAIADRGIGAGERALLMFAPGTDYVTGFFGCLYAGVVAVPVYPPEDARGLERISGVWEDCTPSAILSTSDIAAVATEWTGGQRLPWLATDTASDERAGEWREPPISPASLAFLQYTSGSTATPKGVMVTHANLLHNSSVICQALRLGPHSRGMSWLPPYHDMGLIGGILTPLYGGFPCVLMPPLAFLRDPSRWLSAISRHRATISAAPDFAYAECVRRVSPKERAEWDLSTWEHALVGAEPVRPSTLRAFTEGFRDCGFSESAWYPCYGLAEATLFVTGGEPGAPPSIVDSDDASGIPLTGCGQAREPDAVAIVDPVAAVACPPGSAGEIWVSGPTVAAGYWGGGRPCRPGLRPHPGRRPAHLASHRRPRLHARRPPLCDRSQQRRLDRARAQPPPARPRADRGGCAPVAASASRGGLRRRARGSRWSWYMR
jgi:acyl-CoA synthetase (AMP-forming)/AMP-acid ligase II